MALYRDWLLFHLTCSAFSICCLFIFAIFPTHGPHSLLGFGLSLPWVLSLGFLTSCRVPHALLSDLFDSPVIAVHRRSTHTHATSLWLFKFSVLAIEIRQNNISRALSALSLFALSNMLVIYFPLITLISAFFGGKFTSVVDFSHLFQSFPSRFWQKVTLAELLLASLSSFLSPRINCLGPGRTVLQSHTSRFVVHIGVGIWPYDWHYISSFFAVTAFHLSTIIRTSRDEMRLLWGVINFLLWHYVIIHFPFLNPFFVRS